MAPTSDTIALLDAQTMLFAPAMDTTEEIGRIRVLDVG